MIEMEMHPFAFGDSVRERCETYRPATVEAIGWHAGYPCILVHGSWKLAALYEHDVPCGYDDEGGGE